MAAETGMVTRVDAADGKVHLIDEAGEFWVLAAGREKTIVHQVRTMQPRRTNPSIMPLGRV